MWQRIKNIYHLCKAVIANIYYGFPSKGIPIIGVTGTDGKTTTTNLIYHILNSAGYKTAMVSTVGAAVGSTMYDVGFHVTTPSSFALQKYIKKAKDQKNDYVVLEITSHALDQNRAWGIPFEIGVLTNVTHEHLDYHKSYKEYLMTKLKLLKKAKKAIVNKDDQSFEHIAKIKNRIAKMTTYGKDTNADVNSKEFPFKTQLLGDFNQYNCLAAIAVCKALAVDDAAIRKGLATFSPPEGRQEIVYDEDFMVMVDFAHTPNSLMQILDSVRKECTGRIIHVFGSAGERDAKKRPDMGKASASYADVVILTAEDPRSEKVEDIIYQIKSGITQKITVISIPDRSAAITQAISMARKNDVVIITGKGHEKSMNLGNGEVPWSDKEEVMKSIQKRGIQQKGKKNADEL